MTTEIAEFESWATENAPRVADARGVSVENVADDPGEKDLQIARVRQNYAAMASLSNDAATWVNKTRAMATLWARKTYPDFTAKERDIMAESEPVYLQAVKIQGEIAVTARVLDKMHFEIQNGRRSNIPSRIHE